MDYETYKRFEAELDILNENRKGAKKYGDNGF